MAGINPMFNLNNSNDDYIKLKKTDLFLEIGVGCDLYLPFFKLRPELKFMYGISNTVDKGHINNIKDKNMLPYAMASQKAHSKMIALTFYFDGILAILVDRNKLSVQILHISQFLEISM